MRTLKQVLTRRSFLLLLLCIACITRATADQKQRLVVSISKEPKLAVFTIDGGSGHVHLESETKTTSSPGAMCFNHKGDILYVGMKGTGALAAYRFDGGNELELIESVPVAGYPGYISIHPNGRYLFSSYYALGQVTVHEIHTDGTLSKSPIQLMTTDEKAHSIVIDPTGKYVFVSHTKSNAIHQFVFDETTGQLRPNHPEKLLKKAVTAPRHLWFHSNLPFAYGSDEKGCSISSYHMNPTGSLTLQETLPSIPKNDRGAKQSTSDIEVHPSGQFVYIANRGHDTIAGFQIDQSSGHLTLVGHTAVAPVPRSFNISSDGSYLVSAGQKSNRLTAFKVQEDGQLQPMETVPLNGSPWWVVFQPK